MQNKPNFLAMKKLLLSLIIILFAGSSVLLAQGKQNVVKTSLTSIFLKTYLGAYERVINPDMSGQLGFYYTGAKAGDIILSGYCITPEFRYYLSEEKAAPNGGFIAPFLRYQSFTIEEDGGVGSATYTAIGGGILVGVQRVFKEKITLSAFIGPWYSNPDFTYEDPDESFDLTFLDGSFRVRSGVNIGFAF